jgi:hypothetical protein
MRYLAKYYKALLDLLVTDAKYSSKVLIYPDNITNKFGEQ